MKEVIHMMMYLLTLLATIISFITCIVHLWICVGANAWKHDSGTLHRRKKYIGVLIHLGITIALFVACGNIAESVLMG